MKRKLCLILVFVLIAATIAGCSNPNNTVQKQNTNTASQNVKTIEPIQNGNWYRIDAELNTKDKTLTAKQNVVYKNNDNVELKELYFHLYPNAFKTRETAPFLFDSFDSAYPRGFQAGGIDISSITEKAGQNLNYTIQGVDSTIMKVELPQALKPGESIELNMTYTVAIPPATERFGWGENNFNLGNWYPIAAVYDQQGWNLDKYYAIGDPFYSDSSNYTVKIKAPKEFTIAASGSLTKETVDNDSKTWEFQGNNMRDFAFIANNKFQVAEQNVDGTIVKSYYYKDDEKKGKEALEAGANSIKIFNKKFGEYPYPTYSVVETEFPSGMEYPGLVYISDNYYGNFSNKDSLTIVVVHETGHQWFYSLVGNDEVDEAWLDEGFATYTERVYFENAVSAEQGKNYYKRSVGDRYNVNGVVVKSLSKFQNWNDYGPAVYSGGATALDELRKKLGDETFFQIMQEYFKEFEHKNATTADFIKVSEKISGQDLKDFFDKWLYANNNM